MKPAVEMTAGQPRDTILAVPIAATERYGGEFGQHFGQQDGLERESQRCLDRWKHLKGSDLRVVAGEGFEPPTFGL